MIRRLRLTNFQSWSEVDLPLSPITVVIGETNAGKSALLRGLASVLFNAFEGQGMVRQGSAVAEVEVELDDSTTVRWARGAGVNRYLLNNQLLDKPGRAVPPLIQDALHIHELEFDGEVVRLQWAPQMDAPFLLADSGAKATRMMGVAGNAAVVAQATRLAQQETRSQQDALRAAETQYESLTRQLQSYEDVARAEPIAQALRDSLAACDAVRQQRQVLQELFDVQASALPAKKGLQARYTVATALVERLDKWLRQEERQQWLSEGQQVRERWHRQERRLSLAERCVAARSQMLRLEEMRTLFLSVADHRSRHASVQARLDQAAQHLDACRDQHDILVASMTCPACGRIKDAA